MTDFFGAATEPAIRRTVPLDAGLLHAGGPRLFDNDEATDEIITFPPDHFTLNLARATRQLYYPETPAGPRAARARDCCAA
jgi:hypothetical protein